jgi:hypothetical protein
MTNDTNKPLAPAEEKWLYEELFVDLAIARKNSIYKHRDNSKKVTFAEKEIIHNIPYTKQNTENSFVDDMSQNKVEISKLKKILNTNSSIKNNENQISAVEKLDNKRKASEIEI